MPGRQVNIWLPVLAPGEPDDTSSKLLAALDVHVGDSCAKLAYASLTFGDHVPPALAELKFKYITEMGRLVCRLSGEHATPPSSSLEFAPYDPAHSVRLKRLLERASEDSLDCPGVRGARHIDDVFEGHLRREGLLPTHWRIVRHQGRDVGCLLVSSHQNRQECEVVYLGLAPEVRGNGWGQDTIRHAQHLASSNGASTLALGCDMNNAPALRTYLRAGFREVERWSIFAKRYGVSQRR
jgi:ribosomal protein S18 acetylase RimI-like enzyme